jgi:hypothetical protein
MRIAFTVLAALSFSLTLMADESFYGTWKLNVAKSKLQCSDIASETMKITATAPNSYNNVTDLVSNPVSPAIKKVQTAIWTAKSAQSLDKLASHR